jgi:hypothetical protein
VSSSKLRSLLVDARQPSAAKSSVLIPHPLSLICIFSTVFDAVMISTEVAPASMELSMSSLTTEEGVEMVHEEPRRRIVSGGNREIVIVKA